VHPILDRPTSPQLAQKPESGVIGQPQHPLDPGHPIVDGTKPLYMVDASAESFGVLMTPQEMGEELADILFVLICVANSQGIDLEASLQQVLDKVWTRDRNRFKPVH